MKGATFVEPELVCEVHYLEMTKSTRKMRAPSFRGMRPDVPPEDCVLEPLPLGGLTVDAGARRQAPGAR